MGKADKPAKLPDTESPVPPQKPDTLPKAPPKGNLPAEEPKLRILTTCVDYSDYLLVTLPTWLDEAGIEVLVVTTPDDHKTKSIVNRFSKGHKGPVSVYETTAFHDNGASFAKARAMVHAINETNWLKENPGWRLFIDADILMMPGWWKMIYSHQKFARGKLVSCRRRSASSGQIILSRGMIGYFQMFHSEDMHIRGRQPPLVIRFDHAGGYDMEFMKRWKRRKRLWIPIEAVHLGETRINWRGRRRRNPL